MRRDLGSTSAGSRGKLIGGKPCAIPDEPQKVRFVEAFKVSIDRRVVSTESCVERLDTVEFINHFKNEETPGELYDC